MPYLCPRPLGESLVWLEPSSPGLRSLGLLVLVKASVVLSYSFCSFVCLIFKGGPWKVHVRQSLRLLGHIQEG